MHLRLLLPALIFATFASAQASEDSSKKEHKGKATIVEKLLQPWKYFGKSKDGTAAHPADAVTWKDLGLSMIVAPQPLKLTENRVVKVTLQLSNKGRKLVQLEFPTTQRIEVLVRNSAGKLVEQWSEDQSFANEPTLVAINPGERLEYSVSVSTRDLAAGEKFFIDAFFPNYEQLKATTQIVPEK